MQMRQTDDLTPRFDSPSSEEQEPITRLIDIHVYDLPAEPQEAPCVESEPDEQELTTADESEQEQPELEPTSPRKSRRSALPLVALACLVLLSVMLAALVFPTLTGPTATVTIVPVTKQIATTSTITVITGQGPQAQAVPGRTLAAITMSQARTAPATGIAHQDAQAARGAVTFYKDTRSGQIY